MSWLSTILDQVLNAPSPPADNPQQANAHGQVHSNEDEDHSSDDESETEGARLSLQFAESCMDYHNIGGSMRDDIRRFAKLDQIYRDIELYVVVQSLKFHTSTSTAAMDFLQSQTFATHVTNVLKMILLAPHTMFYVTPLQEWVLNDMIRNPTAYKIPHEIIDNNDQWELFAQAIRVHLTVLRSQIKSKVFKAYGKRLDINQIMFKVAPKQAVISDSHRARLAWIVLSIDEFKEACENRSLQKGDFWEFLEKQLVMAKEKIANNLRFRNEKERSAKLAELFTTALNEHNRMFPTRVKRGCTGDCPGWQETIEISMGMGREIYPNEGYGNQEASEGEVAA